MKNIFFALLVLCFTIQNQSQLLAQSNNSPNPESCMSIEPDPALVFGSNCLIIQEVFDNCDLIYLKVNVHFFLDDNCENGQNPSEFANDPYAVYTIAENLIADANNDLSNNQDQLAAAFWNAPFNSAHCNPVRYVLKGVHTHCNTAAQSVTGNEFLNIRTTFGVNIESEINIFYTDIDLPAHPTAGGVATFKGFHCAIEYTSEGLLNHEIGHNLSLVHTFSSSEPCDDTPDIRHDWDANCDGSLSSSETNRECWREQFDVANNPTCNPPPGCDPNPCCDWNYVNNNVMANNAFQDCYTNCQLLEILNNINSTKCDFIEVMGNNICPPPAAVVDVHVLDDLRTEYCSYCLRLEASSNEVEYMLDFYEVSSNGTETFHTTTGWLDGPAERYCILTKKAKSSHNTWFGGFKPTTTYKVTMTVVNSCGDQTTTDYTFTTPMTNCTNSAVAEDAELSFYPNPFTDNLTIKYQTTSIADVRILASHSVNGKYGGYLEHTVGKPAGAHSLRVNTSSWYNGVNYVTIQIDDKLYSSAVIKQ